MYLSIDIGGSYLKYARVAEDFTIIEKWKKKTIAFPTSDLFFDYLCQDIHTEQIDRIGISSPGIISEDATVLSKAAGTISIMYLSNIRQEVSKRLLKPVAAINDARAAGVCEVTLGNGKNCQSSVYWLIGTGIGGSIFENNRLIKGIDNLAGEFSHLPMAIEKGKIKSLSSMSSIPALITIYKNKTQTNDEVTSESICSNYLKGDKVASQAVEEWCLNIAQGLHLVRIFYNPEMIFIGGAISEQDWFIKKLQKLFYSDLKHTFQEITTTQLDRCRFRNDANLIGAAIHASKALK